jgi:hypothetical protein
MSSTRTLLLAGLAASAVALLVATPASARTICRPDGVCFNTSGKPIAPWQQPAYQGDYEYGNYPYHHHRHWRPDYY